MHRVVHPAVLPGFIIIHDMQELLDFAAQQVAATGAVDGADAGDGYLLSEGSATSPYYLTTPATSGCSESADADAECSKADIAQEISSMYTGEIQHPCSAA